MQFYDIIVLQSVLWSCYSNLVTEQYYEKLSQWHNAKCNSIQKINDKHINDTQLQHL